MRFTGTYRKGPYFFYEARLYVEGKLYDKNGKLRFEGIFYGSKNYEFKEGIEYTEEGSAKKIWKE